jgi:hypothetical protein
LILHRLTPKLSPKNGQVGPQFGPHFLRPVSSNFRRNRELADGGGLLNHPDLFAQTDFRLFLLALRTPQLRQNASFAVYCSASVQQKLADFLFAPTGR